jgi:dipeptidyl aminopeptidase/acylaminoacyl peptidase
MRTLSSHGRGRWAGAAALAAAALAGAVPAAAQAPRPHSIDDWMTVTRVSSFVWAPDGRSFYLTSNAGDSGVDEIFRVPAGGGAPVQVSRTEPGVRAEPKENLVVSNDGGTLFYTQARYFQNIDNIFSLPAAGGEARQLTFNDAVIETAPTPSPDGRRIAYFTRTGRGVKIFTLELGGTTAWPRMLDAGNGNERDPVWSPDGSKIAFWRGGDTWVMSATGGEARRVAAAEYGTVGSPVWSPDGMKMLVSAGGSGFSQLGVVDLASGVVTPLTYGQAETSEGSWSPDGRWVVYIVNDGLGMSRQVMLAAADGRTRPRALTRGTAIRRQPQFSPDGRSIAYIETTGNRTADIWTIGVDGGTPRQVTNSMGRIDPNSLPLPEEVTYPGPDNLRIPALLYKPVGFDPSRKYPVIVLLHGHPGQWNHTMDPEWQYFVERGYVMIAPNPRGSMGFGAGFHDLHVGDYGGTEYEDIMNVLNYLRAQPYIDMTRKATWGGSGGGYMSFWISTQAPDTFQAQVIRAPVSNWKWLAMERYVSPSRFATPTRDPGRAREEMGGAYTDIPERYDERSPLNFIDRVRVPQLLMHGQRDSSVPPNESRRWAQGLAALGRGDQIDFVEYPDEDHTLKRYRATVRDRLLRMESFFAEHLRLPPPAR